MLTDIELKLGKPVWIEGVAKGFGIAQGLRGKRIRRSVQGTMRVLVCRTPQCCYVLPIQISKARMLSEQAGWTFYPKEDLERQAVCDVCAAQVAKHSVRAAIAASKLKRDKSLKRNLKIDALIKERQEREEREKKEFFDHERNQRPWYLQ